VSRGPGKWQRAILDAIAERDEVRLQDLMPPEPRSLESMGDYLNWACARWSAICRAARVLERKGLILRRMAYVPGGHGRRELRVKCSPAAENT